MWSQIHLADKPMMSGERRPSSILSYCRVLFALLAKTASATQPPPVYPCRVRARIGDIRSGYS